MYIKILQEYELLVTASVHDRERILGTILVLKIIEIPW
jgi:hypothetical protein